MAAASMFTVIVFMYMFVFAGCTADSVGTPPPAWWANSNTTGAPQLAETTAAPFSCENVVKLG